MDGGQMPGKDLNMTDQERYDNLEKKEQAIRAAKAALRQKMKAAEHKKFYDACVKNRLTVEMLNEVPMYGLFMAFCRSVPMPANGDGAETIFEYVIRHGVFRDAMAKAGIEFPLVDGAPGRAQ